MAKQDEGETLEDSGSDIGDREENTSKQGSEINSDQVKSGKAENTQKIKAATEKEKEKQDPKPAVYVIVERDPEIQVSRFCNF